MQFVGGHKFWTSRSSVVHTFVVHTFVCLCAVSPHANLCHKYISLGSQVAHMFQHRPEVRKSPAHQPCFSLSLLDT